MITARLPEEVIERVDRLAERTGCSRTDVIRKALKYAIPKLEESAGMLESKTGQVAARLMSMLLMEDDSAGLLRMVDYIKERKKAEKRKGKKKGLEGEVAL